eukprot:956257-Amphidinium_carterae.1
MAHSRKMTCPSRITSSLLPTAFSSTNGFATTTKPRYMPGETSTVPPATGSFSTAIPMSGTSSGTFTVIGSCGFQPSSPARGLFVAGCQGLPGEGAVGRC